MAGPSPTGTASEFAALLRRQRIEAGLTQAALAERAGLSLRGIQQLEAGRGVPYPDTARRLTDAVAFGLQACWSMCWEGESTPPFWPWVQLTRQAGRTTSPADLSAELDALGIRYLPPELLDKLANALAGAAITRRIT